MDFLPHPAGPTRAPPLSFEGRSKAWKGDELGSSEQEVNRHSTKKVFGSGVYATSTMYEERV